MYSFSWATQESLCDTTAARTPKLKILDITLFDNNICYFLQSCTPTSRWHSSRWVTWDDHSYLQHWAGDSLLHHSNPGDCTGRLMLGLQLHIQEEKVIAFVVSAVGARVCYACSSGCYLAIFNRTMSLLIKCVLSLNLTKFNVGKSH